MQMTDEVGSAGSGVLMIHLLGRCNLRCQHCYMEGSPERTEILSADDVCAAIEEAPRLGVGQLYITGGEPLLHPGLWEVLETGARAASLKVTLCTNATRLRELQAERLAHHRAALNISIDGEPASHDTFRQRRGAFATAERGLKLAVAAGSEVTVITTITRRNLGQLPALVEWAVAAGATTFRAQPLLRLGRATTMWDDALSPEELNLLVLSLTDLANQHRSAIKCAIIGQSRRYMLAHPCAAYVCNGGGCHRRVEKEIKKLVVREGGDILPEATNLDPRYRLGRLGEAPLTELVQSYFEHGYSAFDRLCRTAYSELMQHWPFAVVPWDQIIAERSRAELPAELPVAKGCGDRMRVEETVH